MYWRFLYERCGGAAGGAEQPGQGMSVIQHVLQRMYEREIRALALNNLAEFEAAMDEAMGVCSEFGSFDDSIVAFAHANYSLRLDDGKYYEPYGEFYIEPPRQPDPWLYDLTSGGGPVSRT